MRPSSSSAGGRVKHPADPSNAWSNESLFNRISRYAMFRPIDPSTADAALQDAFGVRNPLLSYAGLGPEPDLEAMRQLMKLLECPKPEKLYRLTGAYLLPSKDRKPAHGGMPPHKVFATHLRFCATCLELGYHCMLYQHWGVARCPMHGIALQECCPDCHKPMVPTIYGVLSKPFCCPRCDHLLLKTAARPEAADAVGVADRLNGDWCNDLQVPQEWPQLRVSVASLQPPVLAHPELQAQRRRWLHRATAWPVVATARWPQFKESLRNLTSEHSPGMWGANQQPHGGVSQEPTDMLVWLREACAVPHEQSLQLFCGSWMRIQYITPQYCDQNLSVVAVALHLTMTQYGRQEVNFHRVRTGFTQPYQGVRWNGVHSPTLPTHHGRASGDLIGMEILGYFALAVLYCAGFGQPSGSGGGGMEWRTEPWSYCPSWIVLKGWAYTWVMRMRPRATTETVVRLIRRYGKKSLQRSVTCAPPTGRTLPTATDLCEDHVPPELLHFPAGEPCKP